MSPRLAGGDYQKVQERVQIVDKIKVCGSVVYGHSKVLPKLLFGTKWIKAKTSPGVFCYLRQVHSPE